MTRILGISAYYHDSAAALLCDGEIVAAAQEERFTRIKHDEAFPENAIDYCLNEAGITPNQLDAIAFYEKPIVKFHRLLETYAAFAPHGLASFYRSMPLWLQLKLHVRRSIRKHLPSCDAPVLFTDHHESHAAAAFYPSPFAGAAILTIDGVGEWTTASIGRGTGNRIEFIEQLRFPHSLGLLYSAFTHYLGFKVNSGEYKLMGLAPYGQAKQAERYEKIILDKLVDLREDGSFRLDMNYFNYCRGLTMTNRRFHDLFGGAPRSPDSPITQREMNLAAAVQRVTEKAMLAMARHAKERTGETNLCLSGGVALNCVGNGHILREKIFDNLFIQPAAGDAGGALGAALTLWHRFLDNPRTPDGVNDSQKSSLLGPAFADEQITAFLKNTGAESDHYTEEDKLTEQVATLLDNGQVVGFFHGRMEFGPRALGARSILGDPRNPEMQSRMNMKIKFRESFRPFAPIVQIEHAGEYFDLDAPSPYMLRVGNVRPEHRVNSAEEKDEIQGLDRLRQQRSDIPAVTHVDYSARVQTVDARHNPRLHALLEKFRLKTGCPVLVNTSFNIRGEPIVCTPEDAYACFIHTEMDALVLENHVLIKTKHALPIPKKINDGQNYRETFKNRDRNTSKKTVHEFKSPARLWNEPDCEVRKFGMILFFGLFILGLLWILKTQGMDGLKTAWNSPQNLPWTLWGIGAVTGVLAVIIPTLMRPPYVAWMLIGQTLGWLMQRLVLTLVFLGLFTPLGLLLRRRSGWIAKQPDPTMGSYWEPKSSTTDKQNYYRQY
jgi:carbamoyltransferase